jgi:hypothetical protein
MSSTTITKIVSLSSETIARVLNRFKKPKNNAFIPVEFSVAAYRFGHSMIRPFYRLNTSLAKPIAIFPVDTTGVPNGDVIEAGESLRGFREFPSPWAIDWRLLWRRFWESRFLETIISSSARRQRRIQRRNRSIATLSPDFGGNAPLWFYILSEAQQQFKKDSTPIRLGQVGGRIVAETFVRLLLEDSQSFLNQAPRWKPFKKFRADNGEFRMADLLKQARLAVETQP